MRIREMMTPAGLGLVILAGCGNSLPPLGTCDVATNGQTADLMLVALPGGGPATFDDLRYSPELMKVVAAPHGTGFISLIDPDSMVVQSVSAPLGIESADASATTVYAADRASDRIIAIDIATGTTVASQDVPGIPDYVRFSPATNEVWVSLPATNRLEILDARSLAAIGSVTLPSPPEGLTLDGERAYAHANGRVIAIDVIRRLVIGEWDTGCGYSHGFPQVDDQYHLAFGGCFKNGGVGVVTMHGECSPASRRVVARRSSRTIRFAITCTSAAMAPGLSTSSRPAATASLERSHRASRVRRLRRARRTRRRR